MAAVGIDIGGTRMRAARVSAAGGIEARAEVASSHDPAVVLARCLALVAEVRGDAVAIGVGVPGQVMAAERRVLSGGYVDLSGFDFAGAVERATGLPVVIENDGTMAMLGEVAFGAAKGCDNVVMLTIGTGIGGAVLEAGRVLRGRGVAGQLGHLVVGTGRPCVCGLVGCVETASSGKAFGVHLAEAGLPADTRAEALLARSDAVARGVITAWAGPLRAAIDTLVAMCSPQVVVIGGGAGAAAVAALDAVPVRSSWFAAPVLAAALGDDAGVIGAAVAALPGGHGRRVVLVNGVQAAAPGDDAGGFGAAVRGGGERRVVLVNGVPASGKSGVARALSDATGWPVLSLDTIKEPFLRALPPGDRLFNRVLGQASYQAIFGIVQDAPPGATVILDAWFGFQPPQVLRDGLARAGVGRVAEVWCHAPPEVIGARYGGRQRVAGHPGLEYVPELVALAGRAVPVGLGPVRRVETLGPVDAGALVAWLKDVEWGGM